MAKSLGAFGGLRYYKLCETSAGCHKYEYYDADRTSTNFGAGRCAYPGRFSAKIITCRDR